MDSEFEKKLQRQDLRPIPAEWRGEILRTAHAAVPARVSWPSTINHQLSTLCRELIWPARHIWTGLAAVWAVIVIVNLDVARHSELAARDFTPPSPAVLMAWREQEWMFTGLAEPAATKDAERPKTAAPGPRSERSAGVASC